MRGSDHRRFMLEALAQARLAPAQGEVPVGAVVVQDGQILASAFNLRETLQDPTAHAELLAVRRASQALGSWRLEGCTVYVTLEPCAMCAGAMILSRVEQCVFGCSDPKGGFLGTLADLSQWEGLNHRFEVVSGVEEAACAEELRAFFRGLRDRRKQASL